MSRRLIIVGFIVKSSFQVSGRIKRCKVLDGGLYFTFNCFQGRNVVGNDFENELVVILLHVARHYCNYSSKVHRKYARCKRRQVLACVFERCCGGIKARCSIIYLHLIRLITQMLNLFSVHVDK